MRPLRSCVFAPRCAGCFAALALLVLLGACRSAAPISTPTPEPSKPHIIVPAGDVRLWVRSVGTGPTLVVINGGPGASHHAIARLESLASPSLRVAFYDQRGM